jgi:hypothetical protein
VGNDASKQLFKPPQGATLEMNLKCLKFAVTKVVGCSNKSLRLPLIQSIKIMIGIERYLVPFEEKFQLFGERHPLMMLFLILDIFDDTGKSR